MRIYFYMYKIKILPHKADNKLEIHYIYYISNKKFTYRIKSKAVCPT